MITEFEELDPQVGGALCNAIIGVLKGSHVGKGKSIKANQLAAVLEDVLFKQVNVRALRKGISLMRMQGEPICSWCRGYYYLEQEIEFALTIQSLTDRMCALAVEIVAMINKYTELCGRRPVIDFKELKQNVDYLIPSNEVDQN